MIGDQHRRKLITAKDFMWEGRMCVFVCGLNVGEWCVILSGSEVVNCAMPMKGVSRAVRCVFGRGYYWDGCVRKTWCCLLLVLAAEATP